MASPQTCRLIKKSNQVLSRALLKELEKLSDMLKNQPYRFIFKTLDNIKKC